MILGKRNTVKSSTLYIKNPHTLRSKPFAQYHTHKNYRLKLVLFETNLETEDRSQDLSLPNFRIWIAQSGVYLYSYVLTKS